MSSVSDVNPVALPQENSSRNLVIGVVTTLVFAASALFLCGRRCTRKKAPGKIAAVAEPLLSKIEMDARVTLVPNVYKYRVGLRDAGEKSVVAAFDLTVADSKGLTQFLENDNAVTRSTPQQRDNVTDFTVSIGTIDEGFAANDLLARITELFSHLKVVSVFAPGGTLAMGPLTDFIGALCDKGIEVKYKVAAGNITV